jgi:hypothetical protein
MDWIGEFFGLCNRTSELFERQKENNVANNRNIKNIEI